MCIYITTAMTKKETENRPGTGGARNAVSALNQHELSRPTHRHIRNVFGYSNRCPRPKTGPSWLQHQQWVPRSRWNHPAPTGMPFRRSWNGIADTQVSIQTRVEANANQHSPDKRTIKKPEQLVARSCP